MISIYIWYMYIWYIYAYKIYIFVYTWWLWWLCVSIGHGNWQWKRRCTSLEDGLFPAVSCDMHGFEEKVPLELRRSNQVQQKKWFASWGGAKFDHVRSIYIYISYRPGQFSVCFFFLAWEVQDSTTIRPDGQYATE